MPEESREFRGEVTYVVPGNERAGRVKKDPPVEPPDVREYPFTPSGPDPYRVGDKVDFDLIDIPDPAGGVSETHAYNLNKRYDATPNTPNGGWG